MAHVRSLSGCSKRYRASAVAWPGGCSPSIGVKPVVVRPVVVRPFVLRPLAVGPFVLGGGLLLAAVGGSVAVAAAATVLTASAIGSDDVPPPPRHAVAVASSSHPRSGQAPGPPDGRRPGSRHLRRADRPGSVASSGRGSGRHRRPGFPDGHRVTGRHGAPTATPAHPSVPAALPASGSPAPAASSSGPLGNALIHVSGYDPATGRLASSSPPPIRTGRGRR